MVKEHGADVGSGYGGMVWCQKVYLCIIGLHKLYTPRSQCVMDNMGIISDVMRSVELREWGQTVL